MNRRTLLQGAAAASLPPWPVRAGSAVPQPLATNLVVAAPAHWQGRECLAVELSEAEQRGRLDRTRAANAPSYAIVARDFTDGIIEVEIGAELTGKGGDDARGFAGLAFHISEDFATHEAIYLRMTNGRLNLPAPPPPRIDRAIQYVAHPDFHFAVSRERFPGRYEQGADVAASRWFRYRLEIAGPRARALIDDAEVLVVDDLHFAGRRGLVGLFVDDGSRGFFRNLSIT
jgi:hypothetical protein